LITVIPIWITWAALQFVGEKLSDLGAPLIDKILSIIAPYAPGIVNLFDLSWFKPTLATIVILVCLCLLGWLVTLVIGRKIISVLDGIIARIPLVHSIYGSIKTLIGALQTKPDGTRRVVLINFPSDAMKTIGFVTRVIRDRTGRRLAAVYVPTTPNPTSGYLEIIPVSDLVSLDWSIEEAMSFVISGGAVAPDTIDYDSTGDIKL
tara:strand:+ start:1249 stop:1866 length:618 start_codon:yes stop_codon:yes gene_type:complete